MMSVISFVQSLLFSPLKFFESIKSDKNANKAIWFTVLSFAIYIILYFIISYLEYNPSVPVQGLPDVWYSQPLMSALILIGYLIISVFLIPVSHAIAVKMGGKGSWEQTVKALFYGSGVNSLVGWVPYIGTIFSVYSIYVIYRGMRVLHGMTKRNALIFLAIELVLSAIVIVFVTMLSTLVFYVIFYLWRYQF